MTINDASLGRFIQFMHKFCTNRRHDELKHATCLLATTFIIIRLLWIYGVYFHPNAPLSKFGHPCFSEQAKYTPCGIPLI